MHLEKEIRDSRSSDSKAKWKSDIERVEKRKRALVKQLDHDEKFLLEGLSGFFKNTMSKIREGQSLKNDKIQPSHSHFLDWGSGLLYSND